MSRDKRDIRGPDDPRDPRRAGDPRDARTTQDDLDDPNPFAGSIFERLAGPACMGFGALIGVLYAAFIFDAPWLSANASLVIARAVLSLLFVTGGAMGLLYFMVQSRGRRTVPLVAEITKIFFFLWLLIGMTFFITLISTDPPPQQTWALIIRYFLVGTIAGTVWMFGLLLALGIKRNLGSRQIVRFPIWLYEATAGVWHVIRRRSDD